MNRPYSKNYIFRDVYKHFIALSLLIIFSTVLLAQPAINSFSPASGTIGTTVTINGSNFSKITNENTVYFGASKATVLNATDTTMNVAVPAGATYQPITVTVNSRIAYSTKPFIITFPGTGTGFKSSSFASRKDFATGGNPRSIAIADFDGDGKPDLFITNQSSSTASIFRNTSSIRNISLANRQDISMEAGPFGVAVGDLDGDGKSDLAISNFNSGNEGSVSIRRNTSTSGNISFSENITIPAGNGTLGVSIADLDGDGKPDLVVTAGNSGIIAVFKNTSSAVGSISFAAPMNISTLQHADHVAIADLDGDNKPEIVTANFSGGSVSIWRNTSSGGSISFSTKTSYIAGSNPVAISTGDFDNDGKIDIAVANYSSSTISVYKNKSFTGIISFSDKLDFATGTEPRYIASADVDGDGKTDIIAPCNTPSSVSVLRNIATSGIPAFANRIEYLTGIQPPSVTIADLDGDSKPEIVVPVDYSSISILRNRIDEPILTSFTPSAARTDSTVTIKGENLSGTTIVNFGATPAASFNVVSDSIIAAKVGQGSTGSINVSTPFGNDSVGSFTYIPPAPLIRSFSPVSGTVGSEIKIIGAHFGNVTSVKFGNLQASAFTVKSDSIITAIVAKGATGDIVLINLYGSDTMGKFTFIPPVPEITSFSPTATTAGTPVRIKGKNFTWTTGVSFGETTATSYTVNSDSTITAFPGKGKSGIIRITTEFGTDTLGTFILLEPGSITSYPNPAKGFAKVAHSSSTNSSLLKLVDFYGRNIKTINIPQQEAQTRIDLSNVLPGIYRLIWTDGQTSINYSILVQ